MEIQVGRNPVVEIVSFRIMWHLRMHSPNSKSSIQPTTVFLPPTSWNSIDTHENISLTQLYRFPPVNECIRSRVLCEMHGDRIYLRFFRVIPGRYGTNYDRTFTSTNILRHDQSFSYSLTVNRKGHLAKVEAGVCKTGSNKDMKG